MPSEREKLLRMVTKPAFDPTEVDIEKLRKRAFNLRWATQPEDVIPLTAADLDFPVAPAIRDAIGEYASAGVFSYGPDDGFSDFREAVAENLRSLHGIDAGAETIMATDGAASALMIAAQAVLSPGEEVITFDPVDFLLPHSAQRAGARVVRCPLDNETGAIPFGVLEELTTSRTRAILLCNPHNPMGRVMTIDELHRIARLARHHNLWIISDEVWSDIIHGEVPMTSIAAIGPDTASRTLTIGGFSKNYGLAGLRIGYIHAPDAETFGAVLAASGAALTTFGSSVLSQVAAVAALRDCRPWLEGFLEHLRTLCDHAVDRLNRIPGFRCHRPQGTYVLFPDIRGTGLTSQEVTRILAEEARVAVVPGHKRWFGPGAEGHIRLSFATSREIFDEALDRMERVMGR
ncbi:MAG TPA: pyridoxal phosphate-dependent aminotransferase, partial [Planctomycetes bacterium]|nr:pyridoxal phosphate-dependent aminotransferase [Planctomycetota bacterium]